MKPNAAVRLVDEAGNSIDTPFSEHLMNACVTQQLKMSQTIDDWFAMLTNDQINDLNNITYNAMQKASEQDPITPDMLQVVMIMRTIETGETVHFIAVDELLEFLQRLATVVHVEYLCRRGLVQKHDKLNLFGNQGILMSLTKAGIMSALSPDVDPVIKYLINREQQALKNGLSLVKSHKGH